MDRTPTEEFLEHVGVKGMKWGVRKDTKSVTKSSNAPVKKSAERGSVDHEKATKIRKKPVSKMSNDELKIVTQRMQLEKNYADLNVKQPNKVLKGSKIAKDYMAIPQLAVNAYSMATSPAAKAAGKLILKIVL